MKEVLKNACCWERFVTNIKKSLVVIQHIPMEIKQITDVSCFRWEIRIFSSKLTGHGFPNVVVSSEVSSRYWRSAGLDSSVCLSQDLSIWEVVYVVPEDTSLVILGSSGKRSRGKEGSSGINQISQSFFCGVSRIAYRPYLEPDPFTSQIVLRKIYCTMVLSSYLEVQEITGIRWRAPNTANSFQTWVRGRKYCAQWQPFDPRSLLSAFAYE